MASIFKQQYTSRDPTTGKKVKKKTVHWYIDYKTADGTRKRVKGFKDKQATAQLAAQLEKESEQAQVGIIDKYKEHRKRPLAEHLEDFKNAMLSEGSTEKHAVLQYNRIKRVFDTCGFTIFDDISASKVQSSISKLRKQVEVVETKGKIKTKKIRDLGEISKTSKNYYLKAVKHFCCWMVQDRRTNENPVEHLKTISAIQPSSKRRALEPEEIQRLLESTRTSDTIFGMSGASRALLYRLAVETGLRASEIRSLKVLSFSFFNYTVTVDASYSKNRKEATIPLKSETAQILKEHFNNKLPQTKAFNLPHPCSISRMFRKDLKAAQIKPEDNGKGKLDFHSCRHTFGTLLAASGVHPKTAQDLMRHSDINLTMSRYTHTLRGQQSNAIESLPDFSEPSVNSQRATGTDDIISRQDRGAYTPAYKKLTKNHDFESNKL
ncbi:MAG: tyrosine-type recombinase/integrase, partial [Planctomycetota bacterium]